MARPSGEADVCHGDELRGNENGYAQSPEQGNFVKQLAATDKKTRDKATAVLTKWLGSRKDVSEEDLKKIWKGFFYCMWHADKSPVQADLATSLAGILTSLDVDMAVRFFGMFMQTLRREWAGIDRLRMDKFYLLVRKFMNSLFSYLAKDDWSHSCVAKFMAVLQNGTLLARDKFAALGINLHLADIYVVELKKVYPTTRTGLATLLEPFTATLAQAAEKVLLTRVQESVFDCVVDETRSTLTSTTEIKKEAEASKGQVDASNLLKGASVVGVCLSSEDVRALTARFFELASASETASPNRKVLYAVHEKLSKLVTLYQALKSEDVSKGKHRRDDSNADQQLQGGVSPAKGKKSGEKLPGSGRSLSQAQGDGQSVDHAGKDERPGQGVSAAGDGGEVRTGEGLSRDADDGDQGGGEESGASKPEVRNDGVTTGGTHGAVGVEDEGTVSPNMGDKTGSPGAKKKGRKGKLESEGGESGEGELDGAVKVKGKGKGKKRKGEEEASIGDKVEAEEGAPVEKAKGKKKKGKAAKKEKASPGADVATAGGEEPGSRDAEMRPGGSQEAPVVITDTPAADVGEAETGVAMADEKPLAPMSVVTQLEQLFQSVNGTSPPAAGTRLKRKAANMAAKIKALEDAGDAEAMTLDAEAEEGERQEAGAGEEASEGRRGGAPPPAKRSRRVRFSLKSNLVFVKNGPVPPSSVRTPPSATPRGSALRAGVKPGPINTKKLKSAADLAKYRIVPKGSPILVHFRGGGARTERGMGAMDSARALQIKSPRGRARKKKSPMKN